MGVIGVAQLSDVSSVHSWVAACRVEASTEILLYLLLYNCTNVLLFYCTTTVWIYYCTTVLLFYCTSVLYYFTTGGWRVLCHPAAELLVSGSVFVCLFVCVCVIVGVCIMCGYAVLWMCLCVCMSYLCLCNDVCAPKFISFFLRSSQ